MPKKTITIGNIIILILISSIILIGYLYFKKISLDKEISLPENENIFQKPAMTAEQIQKQLEELEKSRLQQSNNLSKKEINNQLNKLESSKANSGTNQLTKEVIQNQLSELEKLRR